MMRFPLKSAGALLPGRLSRALSAVVLVCLCGAVACGSQHKQPAAKTATQVQRSGNTTSPGAGGNSGLFPGSSQGGFAPGGSPVPAPTCGPSDLLRLVDKSRALPSDYVPPDLVTLDSRDESPRPAITLKLRRDVAESLHRMLDDARRSSMFIVAISTYRDYMYQEQVYQQEVRLYGQAQADRESALAGHSEHQLGTAIDFSTRALGYDTNEAFGTSAEGRWLQQHAVEYGFVLSYPQGKEQITGYMYEPWHYRFVGPTVAQDVVKSGLTLEEWLQQHPGSCNG